MKAQEEGMKGIWSSNTLLQADGNKCKEAITFNSVLHVNAKFLAAIKIVFHYKPTFRTTVYHEGGYRSVLVMEEGTLCENEKIGTILPSDNKCNSIKSAENCDHIDFIKSSEPIIKKKNDGFIHEHLRNIFNSFTEGFDKSNEKDEDALYSESLEKDDAKSRDEFSLNKNLHDVLPQETTDDDLSIYKDAFCDVPCANYVVKPQSWFYVGWLTIVAFAYLYNCWVIPLRITFPYQTPENTHTWLVIDYFMDFIYLLDIVFIKPRIIYLEDGFWIRNYQLTRKNYFQKLQFKMDLLSLLPTDLLYFQYGTDKTFVRLPRLLKIQTFWEFFNHFDRVLASPYVVRVTRTLTYMLYLVHLNTCAYYAVSVREGLGSNKWVYDGQGNAYIRCFYRATKTATSIGKNPKPSNEIEYLFMTISWLMGVFVFAILIGQIRDIVATASKCQTEYRKLVDETLDYLRRINVPPAIRERVEQWFSFTWEQQRTLDEKRILDALPHKLKTDVAINVHIKTLSKVELFHDCDEALLRELVLKLRPVLYLPGDYICRKGEVGKEMYIVKTGQVQVVSGYDTNQVLATLKEGSVFGEISLLNLAGTNRRTAHVSRSHGFSSLFVLSKNDLNETIQYYPNAQELLKKKAKQLIRQNASKDGSNNLPREILCETMSYNDRFPLTTFQRSLKMYKVRRSRKRKHDDVTGRNSNHKINYNKNQSCKRPRLDITEEQVYDSSCCTSDDDSNS